MLHESAASKVLLVEVPTGERDQSNLFRNCIRGREIVVVVDEDATEHEHRVVWRGYELHSLRDAAFPVRTSDQVVASLGPRCAFADSAAGLVCATLRSACSRSTIATRTSFEPLNINLVVIFSFPWFSDNIHFSVSANLNPYFS
jgi:hypothetical protein